MAHRRSLSAVLLVMISAVRRQGDCGGTKHGGVAAASRRSCIGGGRSPQRRWLRVIMGFGGWWLMGLAVVSVDLWVSAASG